MADPNVAYDNMYDDATTAIEMIHRPRARDITDLPDFSEITLITWRTHEVEGYDVNPLMKSALSQSMQPDEPTGHDVMLVIRPSKMSSRLRANILTAYESRDQADPHHP
jgi:hypothetical protein